MSVLIAYANTAAGAAALRHGRRLAADDGEPAVVFDLEAVADSADRVIAPTIAAEEGERWFGRINDDPSPADDLLEVAAQLEVDLIVLGVRAPSPSGKLVLGANVQRIILDARVPVLSVKPD
ncbi:MAG: universal stress protein [Tetrasphaera sp.]